MILDDDELEARLNHPDNLVNRIQIKNLSANRDRGDEIPSLVRQLIAITAVTSDEDQRDIAEVFDITQPHVSQLSRGLLDKTVDKDLLQITQRAIGSKEATAHEKALDNLLSTLNTLAPKLADVSDPRELSKIAVDMSKVVNVVNKSKHDENLVKPQVIIHTVNLKQENFYESVEV